MIPYFELPVYHVAGIPIDPWGTLVCIGFVLGLEIVRARGIKLGLDVRDVIDGIIATVGMGFVGGHLVHVLAYHPDKIQTEGWITLLKIWAGFSSFGGFIGAVVGSILFYKVIRPRPYWVHADTIMFGFPFGWIFGRLGCFSVHDHRGRITDFPLAVRYSDGARYDLGLMEALWAMVIAGTFLALSRSPRKPGTFAAVWCVMYAPVRFGFDFLRATDLPGADVRWNGLTPAQWGCILMFCGGLVIFNWLRSQPRSPDPVPA